MITKLITYDLILKTIVIMDTKPYIFQIKRQNIVSVLSIIYQDTSFQNLQGLLLFLNTFTRWTEEISRRILSRLCMILKEISLCEGDISQVFILNIFSLFSRISCNFHMKWEKIIYLWSYFLKKKKSVAQNNMRMNMFFVLFWSLEQCNFLKYIQFYVS